MVPFNIIGLHKYGSNGKDEALSSHSISFILENWIRRLSLKIKGNTKKVQRKNHATEKNQEPKKVAS
jgi:hypothetical protein